MTPAEPEFARVKPRDTVPAAGVPPAAAAPAEEEERDHCAEEPLLPTVDGAAKGSDIAAAIKACKGRMRELETQL